MNTRLFFFGPHTEQKVPTDQEEIFSEFDKVFWIIIVDYTFKVSLHPNYRTLFSHFPLVASVHADSFGFIGPGLEMSTSVSASVPIQWKFVFIRTTLC